MSRSVTVAIIQGNWDTARVLATCMADEGWSAAVWFGVPHDATDIRAFLHRNSPRVCLYDAGRGDGRGWEDLPALAAAFPDCRFITLTTGQVKNLESPAPGVTLVQQPFDLDDLCHAVRMALRGT